jgi:AcrR family transcriptional regulator
VARPSAARPHASARSQPGTAADPAPGLDERAIVAAALDIIAAHGLQGLSMRALSLRLGVALGATYRHVPTKHELLRLVAAELYARITPADGAADEFEQAKLVMIQIHDVLAAYPGMAAYIAQHVPEFTSARVASLITGPLRAAGLPSAEANRIIFALVLLNAGHMLFHVPPEIAGEAAAAFEDGVDLILRGARARARQRAGPKAAGAVGSPPGVRLGASRGRPVRRARPGPRHCHTR